jgi:type II secretory pathway pseudopilin PulG
VTLVELVATIAIMAIVSTLILITYFGLSSSYSYSVASSNARDSAREAIARMTREIRDAQFPATGSEAAIYRARERWIALYTTFNLQGNADPGVPPRLVMYRLYSNSQIWRFADINGDGVIAGVDMNPTPDGVFLLSEETAGEGRQLILDSVVDYGALTNPKVALFRYSYVNSSGVIVTDSYVYYPENRSQINNVQIHILVDVNPEHPPVYSDFQTSAQLRNQRLN